MLAAATTTTTTTNDDAASSSSFSIRLALAVKFPDLLPARFPAKLAPDQRLAFGRQQLAGSLGEDGR